jgi:hypothetical protein
VVISREDDGITDCSFLFKSVLSKWDEMALRTVLISTVSVKTGVKLIIGVCVIGFCVVLVIFVIKGG